MFMPAAAFTRSITRSARFVALFAFQGFGRLHLLITWLREIPIEVGKKTESQFV